MPGAGRLLASVTPALRTLAQFFTHFWSAQYLSSAGVANYRRISASLLRCDHCQTVSIVSGDRFLDVLNTPHASTMATWISRYVGIPFCTNVCLTHEKAAARRKPHTNTQRTLPHAHLPYLLAVLLRRNILLC